MLQFSEQEVSNVLVTHICKYTQENLRQVAVRATELRNLRRDISEDFNLRAAARGALWSQEEPTAYIFSLFPVLKLRSSVQKLTSNSAPSTSLSTEEKSTCLVLPEDKSPTPTSRKTNQPDDDQEVTQ
jgi:hypothetical protein